MPFGTLYKSLHTTPQLKSRESDERKFIESCHQMNLREKLLYVICEYGFEQPSPIQWRVIKSYILDSFRMIWTRERFVNVIIC